MKGCWTESQETIPTLPTYTKQMLTNQIIFPSYIGIVLHFLYTLLRSMIILLLFMLKSQKNRDLEPLRKYLK